MKKIISIFVILLLLNIGLAAANGGHEHEIEEGKKLVESGVGCGELSDEQLEAIGDYYMEQMHPGKSHELMHEMMGGHDSELTENMHVNMARSIYCGETNQGMMGMMPIMMGGNMMGSGGMMNMMGGQTPQTNMMQGVMGNLGYGFGYWSFWNIIWLLFWIGILLLIFWLIYKFVIQKRKNEYPSDILKKRFAKGEISKKQFEEMKKEIRE